MNRLPFLVVCLPLVVSPPTSSADEATLAVLKHRCSQARLEKLVPLREAAIEDCVNAPRSTRTREDCEWVTAGFGQGGGTINGGHRPGMFIDLPECVEYIEAVDEQNRNRPGR